MVFIASKLRSMPERFRVVCIPYKALYKCSDLPYPIIFSRDMSQSVEKCLILCHDGRYSTLLYSITKTNWFIMDSIVHYVQRIEQKINIKSKHNSLNKFIVLCLSLSLQPATLTSVLFHCLDPTEIHAHAIMHRRSRHLANVQSLTCCNVEESPKIPIFRPRCGRLPKFDQFSLVQR